MRSPIRSGRFDLKECSFRIGWPFFLAYRQAGVTFFCHKKSDRGKNEVKGKSLFTEKIFN
jgi:hypothetical protein